MRTQTNSTANAGESDPHLSSDVSFDDEDTRPIDVRCDEAAGGDCDKTDISTKHFVHSSSGTVADSVRRESSEAVSVSDALQKKEDNVDQTLTVVITEADCTSESKSTERSQYSDVAPSVEHRKLSLNQRESTGCEKRPPGSSVRKIARIKYEEKDRTVCECACDDDMFDSNLLGQAGESLRQSDESSVSSNEESKYSGPIQYQDESSDKMILPYTKKENSFLTGRHVGSTLLEPGQPSSSAGDSAISEIRYSAVETLKVVMPSDDITLKENINDESISPQKQMAGINDSSRNTSTSSCESIIGTPQQGIGRAVEKRTLVDQSKVLNDTVEAKTVVSPPKVDAAVDSKSTSRVDLLSESDVKGVTSSGFTYALVDGVTKPSEPENILEVTGKKKQVCQGSEKRGYVTNAEAEPKYISSAVSGFVSIPFNSGGNLSNEEVSKRDASSVQDNINIDNEGSLQQTLQTSSESDRANRGSEPSSTVTAPGAVAVAGPEASTLNAYSHDSTNPVPSLESVHDPLVTATLVSPETTTRRGSGIPNLGVIQIEAYVGEEVVVAEKISPWSIYVAGRGFHLRSIQCVVGVIIAVFCIMAAIPLIINRRRPSITVPTSLKEERFSPIQEILIPFSGENSFTDITSPQYRALEWIADKDTLKVPLEDMKHIIHRYALAVLYFSTGGENWTEQFKFLSEYHECAWNGNWYGKINGVDTCTSESMVDHLSLEENGLNGTIPLEIGLLTSLKYLILFDNSLSGSIPSSLGNLSNLTQLYLYRNKLSGTVPSELGSLQELELVFLNDNDLKGDVSFFCNSSALGKVGADCADLNCTCRRCTCYDRKKKGGKR